MNLKLRKQLFLAVRDLPYKISNQSTDTSCVAKTKILGELFTRLGLECQVWQAVVDWKDIGLPGELLKLAPRPFVKHFFLKVFIPETKKWVVVDPTWDMRFRGQLPVNDWDGLTNTTLAYPSQQLSIVTAVDDFNFRNFDPTDIFTQKLNSWYQSLTKRKI